MICDGYRNDGTAFINENESIQSQTLPVVRHKNRQESQRLSQERLNLDHVRRAGHRSSEDPETETKLAEQNSIGPPACTQLSPSLDLSGFQEVRGLHLSKD